MIFVKEHKTEIEKVRHDQRRLLFEKEQKVDKKMEMKVGRTNFLVNIYLNKDGTKTYKDKIARLIKIETEKF